MKKLKKILIGAGATAVVVGTLGVSTGTAKADVSDNMTATVQGVSTTHPTNGVLYVYDNATAKHHTRTIEYYQRDGYSKTENLVSSTLPIGVILKQEDIENACKSSTTDGSLNPVGGYNIHCGGVLVTGPTNYPLGGDLLGRFTRIPSSATHVNENAVGNGPYLQVGNKDHGGMTKIEYYANVAGTDVHVNVTLPKVAAVDYNGVHRVTQALITRVVLLPTTVAPHAVLVLK